MKKKIYNIYMDIVVLIGSIISIFFGGYWYIALTLSILSLIYSISSIKQRGNTLAKVSTVFSILGIVICASIYISTIMIILIEIYF